MLSYPAEVVFDTLQLSLLGRAADPETRAHYIRMLEREELGLPQIVEKIFQDRERQKPFFTAGQAIDAIHFAALGRLPDDSVRDQLADRINASSRSDVLNDVAGAVYNSAEHQNRLLPANFADRVLVDHSPNGEFIAMLRLFLGVNGRGTIVEVGLSSPSASYSVDFLRLSGWRGILIEPSSELCAAIEARFSGADFELIRTRADTSSAQAGPGRQAPGSFGLAEELDQVGSGDAPLASVLAGVNSQSSRHGGSQASLARSSAALRSLSQGWRSSSASPCCSSRPCTDLGPRRRSGRGSRGRRGRGACRHRTRPAEPRTRRAPAGVGRSTRWSVVPQPLTVGPWLVLVLVACGLTEITIKTFGPDTRLAIHAWPCSVATTTAATGGVAALVWVASKSARFPMAAGS